MPQFVQCNTENFQPVELKYCIIYAIILYGAISVRSMIYNNERKRRAREYSFYSLFSAVSFETLFRYDSILHKCRRTQTRSFFFFAFILISSGKLNWYLTCEIQEENAKNNAIDGLFSKCFSFISLNILLCLEIVFVFNCSGFAFLLNVSFCWRFQMNSNHFHWMVFFVHPKALIIFVFANKFMLPITFIVLLKKKRFYTFYIRTN